MDAFLEISTNPVIHDSEAPLGTDKQKFEAWLKINDELEKNPDGAKAHLYEWVCKKASQHAEQLRQRMQAAVDLDQRLATDSLRDQFQRTPLDSPWFAALREEAPSDDANKPSVVLAQFEASRAAVRAAMQALLSEWAYPATADSWAGVEASLESAAREGAAASAAAAQRLTAAQQEAVFQEVRVFLRAYQRWLERLFKERSDAKFTVEDSEGLPNSTSSYERYKRWPRALRARMDEPWVLPIDYSQIRWDVPHEDLKKMDAELQQAMLHATAGLILRDLPASIIQDQTRFVDTIIFLAAYSAQDAATAVDALVCNNAACSLDRKFLLLLSFFPKRASPGAADSMDRIAQHICTADVEAEEAVSLLCRHTFVFAAINTSHDTVMRVLRHVFSKTTKRAWFERPDSAPAAYRYRLHMDPEISARVLPSIKGIGSLAGPQWYKRQRLD